MTILVVEDGNLSYGDRKLLDNIRLRLSEHERIGLVGPNGSGKTTLLRVLAQQQRLDSGRITTSKYCKIGYLPQDIAELIEKDVLTSVLSVIPGRSDIEARLAELEQSLTDSATPADIQMELVDHLAELHQELDHHETWYSERRAVEILVGLGFASSDMSRPPGEFSGGWKMRIALARLLFQGPDVLLLDEPTNHLDVPSVTWLNDFLSSYRRAIVLICHDRTFLNRHIGKIWSFEPEGLRQYVGNYDDYLRQRAEEEEILEAQARNQEQKLRELNRFVERVRARASKARQAQSRTKVIEKLEKELVKPIARPRRLSFRFGDIPRSGRDVVRLDNIGKSYGSQTVLHSLTKTIHSGDRISVIGRNGTGKTTLLKVLATELAPDTGQLHWGSGVERGYYAQHHTELLSTQRTVLEEVWAVMPTASQTHVRSVCGAFLFSGDEVDKPIAVLSGGERARVLLARLLVRPGNFLLLDEPTNHLDIGAAEALADALADYSGTMVVVSHNLGFVNRIATQVWDLSDGGFVVYPGRLDEYLDHQKRQTIAAMEPTRPEKAIPKTRPQTKPGGSQVPSEPTERNSPQKRQSESKTTAITFPSEQNLHNFSVPQQIRPTAKPQSSTHHSTATQPSATNRSQTRNRHDTDAPVVRAPKAKPDQRQNRQNFSNIENRIAQLEAELVPLAAQLADPNAYANPRLFSDLLKSHEQIRRKIEELQTRLPNRHGH